MGSITRVTEPTLDVLDFLYQAHRAGRDVHGWEIKKETGRPGPTVYGVIDRLEDAGLVEGHWEEQDPHATGPRRRYYHLTGEGVQAAASLLAKHRERRSPIKPRLRIPRVTAPRSVT